MGKPRILFTLLAISAATAVVSGCNRSINDISPSSGPQRLPAAPVGQVDAGQLPPPTSAEQLPQPVEETAPTETEVAAVEPTTPEPTAADTPPPSREPVTRESVSGAWVVASDNPDCRMILAFTKWSGGYRAATKRCTSSEVGTVSAWDVKGEQVVLMDANGNTVARLYNSGGERYDGTTTSGNPISFSR